MYGFGDGEGAQSTKLEIKAMLQQNIRSSESLMIFSLVIFLVSSKASPSKVRGIYIIGQFFVQLDFIYSQ